ncbi:MAG: hypothetical protein LBT53_09775 [Puniceicoccales bacterium]|jgi:hypothetical protein|nr:hypothetical protein [Puniceicoccales bacterium]
MHTYKKILQTFILSCFGIGILSLCYLVFTSDADAGAPKTSAKTAANTGAKTGAKRPNAQLPQSDGDAEINNIVEMLERFDFSTYTRISLRSGETSPHASMGEVSIYHHAYEEGRPFSAVIDGAVTLFNNGGPFKTLLELAWVKTKRRDIRLLILLLFYTEGHMDVCISPQFEIYSDLFNKTEWKKRQEELEWVKTHHEKYDARIKKQCEKLKIEKKMPREPL